MGINVSASTTMMALRMNFTTKMALRWALMVASLAVTANAAITCPRPANGPGDPLTPGATITINVAPMDQLCMLVRLTTTTEADGSKKIFSAPAGRSYNNKGWERVQGPYTSEIKFNCKGFGGACQTTLPMLDDPAKEKLVLISYSHKLTGKEEVARFLEQATFGPKRSEIAEFDASNPNFAGWVKDQMDVSKKGLTSHREYFRKRTNGRATGGEDQNIASADKPCDKHSRWKTYAFGFEEARAFTVTFFKVSIPNNSTEWFLVTDNQGFPRTEVPQSTFGAYLKDGDRFNVCYAAERSNAPFAIRLANNSPCLGIASGNPLIQFHVTKPLNIVKLPESASLEVVDVNESMGSELVLSQAIQSNVCANLPTNGGVAVHATRDEKTWYLHDPRIVLQSNTAESPLPDGGGAASFGRRTLCSAVPRTFLNEENCILSMEHSACGPSQGATLQLPLTESSLKEWYTHTGKLIYALKMFQPMQGPCKLGATSRWFKREDLKTESACSTMAGVSAATKTTIKTLIQNDSNKNPYIKDLKFASNAACDANDNHKGMKLWVEGTCWEHVHDDQLNVYDFTDWSVKHGGSMFSGKGTSPIKHFADRKEVYLLFPTYKWAWHEQNRWMDNKQNMQYVGRFGDEISFNDLPFSLRTDALADLFGASGSSSSGRGTIVCGSPYEVANDPMMGDEFDMAMDARWDRTDSVQDFEAQKWSVWNTIALYSNDQLRQRMAFALSQVFAMVPGDIDQPHETESHLHYYDIFVRHAFGKYEDILKEVAYHPMMAEMLTFLENKSSGYAYEKLNLPGVYPDENFSREIMQLFSIGLVKLNLDGTPVVRDDGTVVQTYSNLNIMDNARAWTGFSRQESRGNVEDLHPVLNRIDPMRINPEWRDPMPKANIFDGYIGDSEVPLCVDFPPNMFLRKGATYRLLGTNKMPELGKDPDSWNNIALVERVNLTSDSGLFAALCNDTNGDGKCEYPMKVVLKKTIECTGQECRFDEPRVVQMGDTFPKIYYEYVRPPCVQFPFYNSALKIKKRNGDDEAVCADPRMNVASEACCDPNDGEYFVDAKRNCMFVGEKVRYATAVSRCAEKGWKTCTTRKLGGNSFRDCSGPYNCCWYNEQYYWTNVDCEIMIKVNDRGEISVKHNHTDIDTATGAMRGYIQDSVKDDNVNFFRVHWRHGSFPSIGLASCNGNCKVDPTNSDICVCKVSVTQSQVFVTLPTAERALEMLKIGGVNPEWYGGSCKVLEQNSLVKAWDCTGSGVIDEDTVFEVSRGLYPKYYLKNAHSSVRVNNGVYEFRNPPQFMTLTERTVREAQYETDAVLRQVAYHPNTAPFMARRIIQRFGISNPSPGYIEAVAMAFLSGTYTSGGQTFGSGQYGDLGATCAAALLHDEARSVVLDADPFYGNLREPLLRVMHVMRSLEIVPNQSLYPHIKTISMREKIGQMAHSIPNVFSYFLPDYIPPGRANAASIYSPEAGVVNTPSVMGIVGGLFSLIKYGLASCHAGFGPSGSNCGVGVGQLTYQPQTANNLDAAIEELSLLLTSGRLTRDAKNLIKLTALGGYNFEEQVRIVQQLIMTTPEFHASGVIQREELRPVPEPPVYSGKGHKTLVFLFLESGFDSFNLMVPDNEKCASMYKMYETTRGPIALTPEELTQAYSAKGSQSVCDSWKFHSSANTIGQLFGDGDAIVFSNIGVLLEAGVNKENWEELHRGTVLFAHDRQQDEVKRIDPFHDVSGTGVLGRITDALTTMPNPFKTGSISMGGVQALTGEDGVSPLIKHVNENGVSQFDPLPSTEEVLPTLKKLNNDTKFDSNVFGDFWSGSMIQSLTENLEFYNLLNNITLSNGSFQHRLPTARQLEVASKLIKGHKERGIDRDFFYLFRPGWDVHGDAKGKTATLLNDIDQSLKGFTDELKAQGKWDDTVIVCLSEFGRTLTANSGGGSDHAWGGQTFIAGGGVKGGRILGTYPKKYDDYDVSRGRLYPAIPFDSMWNGVAKWMGVPDSKMDRVLPNRFKFNNLYEPSDLFTNA